MEALRDRLLTGTGLRARRLDVAGTSTALLEAGEGPPLVLLHGGIECGGVYWAPAAPSLARSHRVVAPDVPGLGESDPLPKLDPGAFAEWLRALLAGISDDPPILVAHSLVGNYAARAAAAGGLAIRHLVIYASPGIGPYRMPIGLRLAAIRFAIRPSVRGLQRFERWPFADPDELRQRDPQWIGAFEQYVVARASVPHVKRTMRRLAGAGSRPVPDDDLRRIDVPVTLLWGRLDRMVPVAGAEASARRLDWPMRVVEGAGHVPHVERPYDFVTALA
jgi:pimeloyl-ACP methyl ester carboxylesterase